MSPKRGIAAVLAAAGVVAAGTWALLPGRLGPVRVETASALGPGDASPIAVTFSVPGDLAAARARLGLDYVAAHLAACGDEALDRQAVVAQAGEVLPDEGRVRRLPTGPDGRFRYRAVFDGQLARIVDHQARFTPAVAAPGGLCFSLHGARMWWGSARSAAVPVPMVAGRRPRA